MQKQLLQLRKFAIFCVCLGAVLLLSGVIKENHFRELPWGEAQRRWGLVAGYSVLGIINLIFLYLPRGSSRRIGRRAFQLFLLYDLSSVLLIVCEPDRFADQLTLFRSLGQFGLGLLYCGNFAICKYRQMLDDLEPVTFRNWSGQMLRQLRPWQIAMWILFLWSFRLPSPFPRIDRISIAHSFWLALTLGWIGIAIYLAIQIRRRWCCPACRTRLPLPRTAWLLLPKRLPQEWQRCPHCGFDFDRELPEAAGAVPAAARRHE